MDKETGDKTKQEQMTADMESGMQWTELLRKWNTSRSNLYEA